jgi:iron-sulfur cluster repair protein YtfE (RIC family)
VSRDVGARDAVLAGWHEKHHAQVGEAETMIDEMGRLEARDDVWLQHVMRLHRTLEQHIQTEEQDIWPRIEQVWGMDKLEQASGPLNAAKAAGTVGATISGALGQVGEKLKGDDDRERHAA